MDASTKAAIERLQHQNTLVAQLPSDVTAPSAPRSSSTKPAQDAYNQSVKQAGPDSHETATPPRT